MTVPVIETERLRLRRYQLEDFEPFRALWMSDDSRYMGGPVKDTAEAWGIFCSDTAQWELLGFGYWAIEERSSGTLAGACGLGKPPSFPERELGWQLFGPFRGKGYATEAADAGRDYAFHTLGWDTLVSYVHLENTASQAVATRLGAVPDPAGPYAEGDSAEDTIVFRHPKGAT